jgi:hypothetical protein
MVVQFFLRPAPAARFRQKPGCLRECTHSLAAGHIFANNLFEPPQPEARHLRGEINLQWRRKGDRENAKSARRLHELT